jgi:hypothetical protein
MRMGVLGHILMGTISDTLSLQPTTFSLRFALRLLSVSYCAEARA